MEPIIPSFEALSSPIYVASLAEAESPTSFVVDLAGIRGKRINALANVPCPPSASCLLYARAAARASLAFRIRPSVHLVDDFGHKSRLTLMIDELQSVRVSDDGTSCDRTDDGQRSEHPRLALRRTCFSHSLRILRLEYLRHGGSIGDKPGGLRVPFRSLTLHSIPRVPGLEPMDHGTSSLIGKQRQPPVSAGLPVIIGPAPGNHPIGLFQGTGSVKSPALMAGPHTVHGVMPTVQTRCAALRARTANSAATATTATPMTVNIAIPAAPVFGSWVIDFTFLTYAMSPVGASVVSVLAVTSL